MATQRGRENEVIDSARNRARTLRLRNQNNADAHGRAPYMMRGVMRRLLPAIFVGFTCGSALASSPILSASFEKSTRVSGPAAANAKTVGTIAFEEGPRGGIAATFDGSSWIEIPDSAALRPGQWTISAWVAPQQNECGGRVIEKGASNSFWLLFSRGKARCGFWTKDAGYQEVDSATAFKADEWRFVAGTFDGSVLKIYVDGELESSMKTQGTPNHNKQPLLIGAKHQGVAGDRLLGAMDEVSFFDRALSDSDIKALFASSR